MMPTHTPDQTATGRLDPWSAAQVCAFSGLDGPTHWANAVGGWLLPDGLGFRCDTQPAITVQVLLLAAGQPWLTGADDPAVTSLRVVSDGVELRAAAGELELTLALRFEGSERLVGEVFVEQATPVPELALLLMVGSDETVGVAPGRLTTTGRQVSLHAGPGVSWRAMPREALADLAAGAARFGEADTEYEGPAGGWSAVARLPLETGPGGEAVGRWAIAFDEGAGAPETPALPGPVAPLLPAPPPPDRLAGLSPALHRCRDKAIAILRANCFAPEGNFSRRWMATQRSAHRNFNTFHAPFLALGALHFDPSLAVELLRSTLSQQQANGQVPEQCWPAGQSADTPPPLLCWAWWEVYRRLGDRSLLESPLSRLKDYVKYPLTARVLERLGHARSSCARFLTWGRGEGSNMDNSPRFDINEPFAAVDLTCYALAETDRVARMIEELVPEHREAIHLGWVAEELSTEVQDHFWHAEDAFFYDRYPDGDYLRSRTIAGLIPLFAGAATAAQAEALIRRHLARPGPFWTPFPIASQAADEPGCDQNMWRGAVWPGMNLLIFHGLRRYGYHEEAGRLREQTLEALAAWYDQTGSLWEFYDSNGQRAPGDLPRGRRTGALPEYGWTAAAFLALLDEPDSPPVG